ncbi:MAG: hypothetical protein VW644_02650, partial [Alphaproteobacteria bacterium]
MFELSITAVRVFQVAEKGRKGAFDMDSVKIETAVAAADAAGAVTGDFTVSHSDGRVPGALWYPAHGSPKGLLLYG